MASTAPPKTCETPSAKQRRVWDKSASGYDKQIAFFEKIWITGARAWLGRRAHGRVLEVAVGTGRNLPERLKAGSVERVHARSPIVGEDGA